MSTDLGTLKYTLTADAAPLEATMAATKGLMNTHAANLNSQLDTISQSTSKMQKAALVGSAAVAVGVGVIGAEAIKAAANFQTLTTELVTGAGESEQNLNKVKNGILAISTGVTASADELAKGMFLIESAGYHGAEGLNVLKIAAQGAEVGGSDLNSTADALTTVMHDYGISSNNAGQAMNFLVSTMQNGKMHMEDLVGVLGKFLPAASQLHVPLAQTGAALATLTQAGIPAARAATALNMTMLQMAAPSTKAVTALQSVGLSADQLGTTLTHQGLLQALQLVTEHIASKFPAGSTQYLSALSDITGGVRGLTGALGTTGTNMSTFVDNTQKITESTNKAGNSVMGFQKANEDAAAKEKELKNTLHDTMIVIGEALLPVVTSLLKTTEAIIQPIAEWISNHRTLATAIIGSMAVFAGLTATLLAIKMAIGGVSSAMSMIPFTKFASEAGIAGAGSEGLLAGLAGALPVLGPVALGLAGVGAAAFGAYKLVEYLRQGHQDATKAAQDHASAEIVAGNALKGVQISHQLAATAVNTLASSTATATKNTQDLKQKQEEYNAASSKFIQAQQAANDALQKYGPNSQQYIAAVEHEAAMNQQLDHTNQALQTSIDKNRVAHDALSQAISQASGKLSVAQIMANANKLASDNLTKAKNSEKQAHDEVYKAVASYNVAVALTGQLSPQTRQASSDLAAAKKNEADKTQSVQYWQNQVNELHKKAPELARTLKDSLGPLVQQYNNLSGAANSAYNAEQKALNVKGGGGINFQNLNSLPHHALGTSYAPGGWSILGEEGPELANIPTGTQIYDANMTAKLLNQGAGAGPAFNSETTQSVAYNFSAGSVILSTAAAVREFFSVGNRNTQLELNGGSPLAGTTGV